MKIGILTFHRPINYGAFLQSYGLSHRLKKDFSNVDVEIIDYLAPIEKKKIYLNVLRRIKKYGIKACFTELKKISVFGKSLSILPLSQKKYCSDNLNDFFEYIDKTYDIIIIGSDAVFNWNQNGYPTAFIPQYNFSVPVLSYAASVHGLAFYSESKERIAQCGKTFSAMKAVYVRDLCTEKFVKYCSQNCNVKHSCDPTFLIDFKQLYSIEHRSFDELKRKYHVSGKYVALMLQNETISREVYERYSKDYTIISLFMNNKYSDCFMYDLSPVEWCEMLKNAEVVVTNYFHGTLLSLQQGTPAMVIDISHYRNEYEGKLYDLMNRRLFLPELYYSIEKWSDDRLQFFNTMEKCLLGDYSNQITNSVKDEADTFNTFFREFSKLI